MEGAKIILASLMLFSSSVYAAVMFSEVTEEDGKTRLVASEEVEIAKNCPTSVSKLIERRSEAFASQEFNRLLGIYAPYAKVNIESKFLNRPVKNTSYTIFEIIKGGKQNRKRLSQYLYLMLGGECKLVEDQLIYKGKEIEKMVLKGKEPIYSYSNLEFRFNKSKNRIIEETTKVKTSYFKI